MSALFWASEAAALLPDAETAFLNAIGAALPLLQEGRSFLVDRCTTGRLADGSPDVSTLEDYARPDLAEFDRAISRCEDALAKAGLR